MVYNKCRNTQKSAHPSLAEL